MKNLYYFHFPITQIPIMIILKPKKKCINALFHFTEKFQHIHLYPIIRVSIRSFGCFDTSLTCMGRRHMPSYMAFLGHEIFYYSLVHSTEAASVILQIPITGDDNF